MEKKASKNFGVLENNSESGVVNSEFSGSFRSNVICRVNGIPSKPGVLGLPVLRRVLLPIIIISLLLLSL
jgi:hypothetical protein